MGIPPSAPLAGAIAAALGAQVAGMAPLRGGDVAEAYRVTMADGTTVFAKTHRSPPPGFFTTEAWGLSWMRDAGALPVPAVLATRDGDPPLLVLSWIDEGRHAPDDEAFGRGLAAMHAAGAPSFGREDRRTTGSRGLPNDPCSTWAEFFAERRLIPSSRLLQTAGEAALGARVARVAERMADERLSGPPEPPARLHGDLWGGNRLVDRGGRSWLIDPACFGGHREFDLAMMRLFGGFGPQAFAAYQEASPLADGWEDRVPVHQLAPLAVHTVKFGGSYGPALARALDAIGA